MEPIEVRPADGQDAGFIRATLDDHWGGVTVAVHGELIDASAQPALVARRSGDRVGLLTYRPSPAEQSWEILTLNALTEGTGVGTALLAAARAHARGQGVRRLWLVTTNDNTGALRFYQRRGFDLIGVHRDAVTAARVLKPAIPLTADGVPIRHELVLETDPMAPVNT